MWYDRETVTEIKFCDPENQLSVIKSVLSASLTFRGEQIMIVGVAYVGCIYIFNISEHP